VSNLEKRITTCSVVLPVYNEELSLIAFHESLILEISKIHETNFHLIYVDDGSIDRSYELLRSFNKTGKNYQVSTIKFSRNFGHQSALLAGMTFAQTDFTITMDSDGQDPPSLIPQMISAANAGFDIVLAQRSSRRGDSFFKRLSAYLYYRVLNKLTEVDMPVDTGDFRLLSKRAQKAVLESIDSNLYLRGLVSWVGFSRTTVFFDRQERISGETKYPFTKMLRLALNGITNFSTKPLRIGLHLSLVIAFFSFFASIFVLSMKVFSPQSSLPGYTTIVVLFLWSVSIQLFCIGLIGEYLAKNIEESRKRPHYLIESED
jgi:glycosyltransferase involved in cell wall biosynthesis